MGSVLGRLWVGTGYPIVRARGCGINSEPSSCAQVKTRAQSAVTCGCASIPPRERTQQLTYFSPPLSLSPAPPSQAFMARDIPRMDWNSPQAMAGVQPYVHLSCGSKSAKTRRKASRDPQWRQEIGLSMMLPPGAHGAPPVRFQLFDHNFTQADKPIAAFRVPYRVRLLCGCC